MSGRRDAVAVVGCALLVVLLAACGLAAPPAAPVVAPATLEPPATATALPLAQPVTPPRAVAPAVTSTSRALPVATQAPPTPVVATATPAAAPTAAAPTPRPTAAAPASVDAPTTPIPQPAVPPAPQAPVAAPESRAGPAAAPPPPPAQLACVAPRDAAGLVGRAGCVEGAVTKVTYAANSRGSPTFVDFGDAFTALVWIEDRSQFPEIDGWQGRRLRVRGAVELYRGRPEIVLRSAEQVSQLGR